MGDWTGTVPAFAAVGNLHAADMTTLVDIDTALVTGPSTWSPTLTSLTLGNGTLIAKYRRLGKWVDYRFKFTLGSTSAVGTNPQFTLPAAPSSDYLASNDVLGQGQLVDSGIANRQASPVFVGGSTIQIQFWNATPVTTGITATIPWTWGTSDYIDVSGTYYTN